MAIMCAYSLFNREFLDPLEENRQLHTTGPAFGAGDIIACLGRTYVEGEPWTLADTTQLAAEAIKSVDIRYLNGLRPIADRLFSCFAPGNDQFETLPPAIRATFIIAKEQFKKEEPLHPNVELLIREHEEKGQPLTRVTRFYNSLLLSTEVVKCSIAQGRNEPFEPEQLADIKKKVNALFSNLPQGGIRDPSSLAKNFERAAILMNRHAHQHYTGNIVEIWRSFEEQMRAEAMDHLFSTQDSTASQIC